MPEAIDFSDVTEQYIEMHDGSKFYIHDPVFKWAQIAYSLANSFRWNGQSSRLITVAEHSIRVSYETEGDPLEALLHDVTETWLPDFPGPFKALLPDYVRLETYLWESFVDWFNNTMQPHSLKKTMSHETKEADWRVLFIEARELMPTQGRDWVNAHKYMCTGLDMPCHFWTPAEAELRFLNRLDELTP